MVTCTRAMAEALFWSGFGVVFLSYAGYPLWLALRARLRPAPVSARHEADERLPAVTCLIAAADEAQFIARKLEDISRQDYPPEKIAVIVVSDGSTDDTDAIVSAWSARDGRVRLVRNERRSGKPTALNRARPEVRGEVLVLMDARQGLPPESIRELVAHLADPHVAVVSGNLRQPGDAYWRYETWVRRNESRSGSMVQATGALYALRACDFPEIPPQTVLDDVYVPLVASALGGRIVLAERAECFEIPTATLRGEFTRKVRTLAGIVQVFHLLGGVLRLGRHPLWPRFLMHKLSRLACPWGLLLLLAGSLLAGSWRAWTALGAVAALGVLALVPYLGVRSRIASASRAFFGLNLAALCAPAFYYLGLLSVTWTRPERERG